MKQSQKNVSQSQPDDTAGYVNTEFQDSAELTRKFLPVSSQEMRVRDWDDYDFLIITGDAYVDHPSFGAAVIGRVLEKEGYKVAICAQPNWTNANAISEFGKPSLAVLITAGNLDSMVAHFTAAKKPRNEDYYSPGKKRGLRPDRATIVYANRAREAFGRDVPIIIGGLEASLRRFAHYDYWDNSVRRSILFDAPADLLIYGMGERAIREVARRLHQSEKIEAIKDVRGTAFVTNQVDTDDLSLALGGQVDRCASFDTVSRSKRDYADATRLQYQAHDPLSGSTVIQSHGHRDLVVLPPAMPLSTAELDEIAELPYTRDVHPMYLSKSGVPAIDEVRFSIIHNRGCFGACHFCSLAWHQGRIVSARSHDSVLREARALTSHPEFKGFINDVGGPTANFAHPSCKKQMTDGMCKDRKCLTPKPCKQLDADHSDYLALLSKIRALPKVKKVFVRSGIRFDYMLEDRKTDFFQALVEHHISGQLKVAPEHCVDSVLDCMGKPQLDTFERFLRQYERLNKQKGKKQFIVPYLMSSHPGSTLADAVKLAQWLNERGLQPEQVQDFYPTPGTLSTAMYYTGIDPLTMKKVYVARSYYEKQMQRALLQFKRPENRKLVFEALHKAGRADLIGHGPQCLLRPMKSQNNARIKGLSKHKKIDQKRKSNPEKNKMNARKKRK